jgi:NTP pyrophosphatase (non-canonical NTP hydrolase)
MTKAVDLSHYAKFVQAVTSETSMDTEAFIDRVREIEAQGINPARLLTGSAGLSSEGGEFNEIVKKMFFHGENIDADRLFHMKRELGDIIWYWITAVAAAGFDPNEILELNVEKLEKRYPGGKFSIHYSANRQEGDI